MRDELLAKGLADDMPAGARLLGPGGISIRNQKQRCGAPDAAPGCNVKTRYIYQVFRNTPKELVFAQTLFGFELAAADPRIVAINFVGGEDNVISMADYAEHMRMIGFLRALYPKRSCQPARGRACAGARAARGAVLPCQARRGTGAWPTASATASTSCTRTGPTTC